MIVLVSSLAACDAHLLPTVQGPPALHGTVLWTRTGMKTAATIEEIQAGGTVALVDPTSHKTLLATQAASGTGEFTFPFATAGTTISPGYYWLEAARFISGSRHAGVTLRTILHYSGSGWDSISGTDVQISPLTTAIARVRALDPVITDAATIGAVVAPHQVVAPLVTYSPEVLGQLAAEIAVTVAGGGDGAGDLPLPATVSPATGTPGITQLTWTGIPLAFDFHTQVASGTDAIGTAQTEMTPAALQGQGWTSIAPAGLVGASQLRLHTGTARTLPQTWTPLNASTLVPTAVSQVATASDPTGPQVAWKGHDHQLRVATVGESGIVQTNVLGTGGEELALGSSGSGQRHVVTVAAGVPHHWRGNGGSWSPAQIIPTAATPVTAPVLVADGQGGLWGAWLSGTAGARMLQVSRWTPAGWQPAEVAAGGAEGFAMVGGPEPQIVFLEPTEAGLSLRYSRRASGDWSEPTTLSATGRDVAEPTLVVDTANQPHVLWHDRSTVASDQKAPMLAFRAMVGGTWTDEERFTPSVVPVISRSGLMLDPAGVPIAYWQNGAAPALVQISRRSTISAGPGTWGRPITLDRTGAAGLAGVAMTGRYWLFWMDGSSSALRGLPVVW